MERICWEGGITTLGAAGSVTVQVSHSAHALLHGKGLRDVMLKVWAALWSPWPPITRGLNLQRDQKIFPRASPVMGCVWCLVFQHSLGKGRRLFPCRSSCGEQNPSGAGGHETGKGERGSPSLRRENNVHPTALLLWKSCWKTCEHMAPGGSLSPPGYSNTRKSWIMALWTCTPCQNGHPACHGPVINAEFRLQTWHIMQCMKILL